MRTKMRPLSRTELESVIGSAVLAPSILNCQPWRFLVNDTFIDVHVDRDRSPSGLDPSGREVMISIGAALLNMRLGLLALGRSPHLHLMPITDGGTLVARMHVGGAASIEADEQALLDAIPERRSSRVPFDERLVPFEDYLHLQEAAEREGTYLDLITGNRRPLVVEFLHEADFAQRADPAAVAEIRRWTVGRTAGGGISDASLGPKESDPDAVVRDFSLGRQVPGRPRGTFERDALLAVLLTAADGPVDRLRAGMGLERVMLTATARGLAVGILSQAAEQDELRPLLRDTRLSWRHPQLVLRFGHAEAMPPSERRSVADVIGTAVASG